MVRSEFKGCPERTQHRSKKFLIFRDKAQLLQVSKGKTGDGEKEKGAGRIFLQKALGGGGGESLRDLSERDCTGLTV